MSDESGAANSVSRRNVLAGLSVAPVVLGSSAIAQSAVSTPDRSVASLKDAKGTKLVLLGTFGGPGPGRTSRSTSHTILSDGAAYIIDCGLGVTNQFAQTGIPFSAVRSIFITHHHPDHNIEYGPFLTIGWIQGLKNNVTAYGPPPLKFMSDQFLRGYKQTIDFWAEDMKMKPLDPIEVTEISAAGLVMQDDKVSVHAVLVQHPPVVPAFAYRFDFKDRSIAFSGDTAPVHAVAELAKGADVLVHESMYVQAVETNARAQIARGRPINYDAYMAHMLDSHSPVEEVGKIAQEAGVKTLVLSHFTPSLDSITDEMWRNAAAKNFKGEIIVGKDLMVI
jgi:ribonuclease BN (tRNA processing enzyme)